MTAKEIILALPSRLKTDEAAGQSGTFHFQIEEKTEVILRYPLPMEFAR